MKTEVFVRQFDKLFTQWLYNLEISTEPYHDQKRAKQKMKELSKKMRELDEQYYRELHNDEPEKHFRMINHRKWLREKGFI